MLDKPRESRKPHIDRIADNYGGTEFREYDDQSIQYRIADLLEELLEEIRNFREDLRRR